MKYLILLLSYLLICAFTHAADQNEYDEIIKNMEKKYKQENQVRYEFNPKGAVIGIVVEGEIKTGDYDKFVELVKNMKGKLADVYLMSPGGNALEAMKIGRLIRTLRMKTWAPMGSPEKPFCMMAKPNVPSNCTCASACFLIFVAGVERNGEVAGIHRVFLSHDLLKNLSSSEAVKVSGEIKKSVSSYFGDMGLPNSLTERVLAVPSGKIEFLSKEEMNKNFYGFILEYQDWVTAKCGDEEAMHNEEKLIYKRSKFKDQAKTVGDLKKVDKEYAAIMDKQDKAFECRSQIGKTLAKEAFDSHFK